MDVAEVPATLIPERKLELPKHGEPDSVPKNLIIITIKWLFGVLVAGALVAVAGVYGANKLLGTGQAVKEDQAIRAAKEVQDNSLDSPVSVASTLGKPWSAWVSSKKISVDATGLQNYGYPGDDVAIRTGRPISTSLGEGYVSSTVSFDLTGRVNFATRITSIKAVIDERASAPDTTFMYIMPQGDSPKGQLGFDLGSDDLEARSLVDGSVGEDSYLSQRTVTLGDHESVGFESLVFAPPNSQIDYHIEVTFDSGKKAIVSNNGVAFRIVSFPESPKHTYVPTALHPGEPIGLYECSWKEGCEASYNSTLREHLPN